jgi:hypothetical protein
MPTHYAPARVCRCRIGRQLRSDRSSLCSGKFKSPNARDDTAAVSASPSLGVPRRPSASLGVPRRPSPSLAVPRRPSPSLAVTLRPSTSRTLQVCNSYLRATAAKSSGVRQSEAKPEVSSFEPLSREERKLLAVVKIFEKQVRPRACALAPADRSPIAPAAYALVCSCNRRVRRLLGAIRAAADRRSRAS